MQAPAEMGSSQSNGNRFCFCLFLKSVHVCPGPTANLCHAVEPLMVDVGVILFPKKTRGIHTRSCNNSRRPRLIHKRWCDPGRRRLSANRALCHAIKSPSSQSSAVSSSHAMQASRAHSFQLQVQQDGLRTRPNHRPLDK